MNEIYLTKGHVYISGSKIQASYNKTICPLLNFQQNVNYKEPFLIKPHLVDMVLRLHKPDIKFCLHKALSPSGGGSSWNG